MPHLTLEYSSNMLEKDFTHLFLHIHELLATQLPTQLTACKSKIIRCDNYVIGDANKNNAFVHLSIKILKGRSLELKNSIANTIMIQLKEAFEASAKQWDLQISLSIDDLPDVYLK